MKAIFTAVIALAATVVAGPIVARQVETQADEIDVLFEKISEHTANINATTAAAPENPNILEQNAAAAALAPDFAAITSALTDATTILAKRAFDVYVRNGGGKDKPKPPKNDKCDNDCLFIKIKKLVFELTCTLRFVIIKLGLGCVLIYLTPLIIALSGLIKALDKVVAGLLYAVKEILESLLGGIAAGLLGLVIW